MTLLAHSQWVSKTGIGEHFFTASEAPGADFKSETAALLADYAAEIERWGCSPDTEWLLRFHLSDVTNQAAELRKQLGGRSSFVSVVGQPPGRGRISLEAWHWTGADTAAKQTVADGVLWQLNNYRASFFHRPPRGSGSYEQTAEAFEALHEHMTSLGGGVADNTVRTWLYCRDVDNNYQGLVRARNDYFAANGLTAATHFIASTGIGGDSEVPTALVRMDSLDFFGLREGQQRYLYAPEYLSPTALYGVSFERGTRLVFGDRSHCYISGTASIDKLGKVLHVGDVRRQARRMIVNIQALLAEGGMTLADLKLGTIYLRDPMEMATVLDEIGAELPPGLPISVSRAPVCRPAWLVEMEAIAVAGNGDPAYLPLS